MGIEQIKRVVVLMLENRSFDHMLGALKDVDGASPRNSNPTASANAVFQRQCDNFRSPNKLDPKHEFDNVQTQLGSHASPFPLSGFVQDAERVAAGLKLTPAQQQDSVQSVMEYFSDGALPGLQTLAKNFAVCDRWFASVPGPTWPNRFFAMMGSCHGQLTMPSGPLDAIVAVRSIADQIGKDTIFSVLGQGSSRVYSDYLVPLSILLKGSGSRASIADFEDDVDKDALPKFCWIEPNFSSNIQHATSQHPPEDVRRGDNLIIQVYNKLRGNPKVWSETLLVVVYDEHGGFYDHLQPVPTVSADDHPSHPAFSYAYTGCRVPCVLVSPWVKQIVVSQDYDHTSLLAFVCDQFGKSAQREMLGRRVDSTDHFGAAPIWCDAIRTSTPEKLVPSIIDVSPGEEASGDLDEMLMKLLMGLNAHAQNQADRFDEFQLRAHVLDPAGAPVSEALPAGASTDDRISQAWQQSGVADRDRVEAMLANVKKAFAE